MSILIIADFDQQSVRAATRSAISAGQQLGSVIDVLVIGDRVQAVAEQLAKIQGVTRVLVAESEVYAKPLAENFAPLVAELAKGYSHILAAADSFGKNLLPRVAALLDVDMVSEVTRIIDASTYVRPLYAGNLNATVQNNETIKLLTIRPTAFDTAEDVAQAAAIEKVAGIAAVDKQLSRFIGEQIQQNDHPDLSTARIVVTGGRSLGSAEKFDEVMVPLANKLHAAIGATRAAVDAGFAPNEWQIGQTGTVVAPEFYIAIGVSGAAQHIAGMKDSRTIIAINHDPDAQIFQWADYGLVADLFETTAKITASY
ncbi:MAG TPA: FAD-binding protein [Cellvibrio sp.]|nr:FAD-binding protein [Cellvibrio sp.]